MPRPRKPTRLHIANGTLRPERHTTLDPEPVGDLRKPSDLDKHASWFWDQHIDQLKTNGAGGGDLAVFVSACEWWSVYQSTRKEAIKPKSDYRIFVRMSMAWKNFNTAASRLGLSPTERAKLRVQPKPEKTKFQVFLDNKKRS